MLLQNIENMSEFKSEHLLIFLRIFCWLMY